jgi:Reverse transcriptase (RNA-dependent DNA polymerase)
MNLPPGHRKENISNLACRLKKSIYGLKQSPRAWYGKLSHFLISYNFKISGADSSLFIKYNFNSITVVLVYVDDLIITGDNQEEIDGVKRDLKEKINIKDLGKLKYFIGIEIAHSLKGLFISQRKYTLDLLKEIRKLGCKPVSTPIDSNMKLNTEDGETLEDINHFQRLVGNLIYLTVIRPDMSFVVSQISKFMHSPRTPHLDVVNMILRYLKGTPRKGIWMRKNNTNVICGYSDADWVGSFDRKSTIGFCTFVGGNLVTWKNKKQSVVARSSAKAEYRAMASTASELTWIKQVLIDLNIKVTEPMKMFCDNQSVRHIATNPVFYKRTKHIEVDCHYIREKVQSKEIKTQFVKRKDQLADIFTKGLSVRAFEDISCKLGSYDIYHPSLRGVLRNKND